MRSSQSPATRPRLRGLLAAVVTVALGLGGAVAIAPLSAFADDSDSSSTTSSTSTTSGSTDSPSPTAADPYVLALWQGGADGVVWPTGGQHLVASIPTSTYDLDLLDAKATLCGTTYQVDFYANDATTTALLAGKVLWGQDNPTESWPGGVYRSELSKIFTTTACAPTVTATATVCSAVDGSTDVTASLASLAADHGYLVELLDGTKVVATKTVAPGGTTASVVFSGEPAGVDYTVRVTDQSDSSLSAKTTVSTSSCPQVGGTSIDLTQCTAVGGSASVVLTPSGLAVGRSFSVHTGSATGPVVGTFVFAEGGSYPVSLSAPASGTSTVDLFVVDDATGIVVAQKVTVTLQACPTLPTIVTVTPAPCTVGQTMTTVGATFGDLTPGHVYQPTLDGKAYGAPFTATAATDVLQYSDVAPGAHTIGIVDTIPGSQPATSAVTVAACAELPKLTVSATQCSAAGGTGSLDIALASLVAGRNYTVSLTSDGKPVAGVADQTVNATSATAPAIEITGLAASASYIVTITDNADPSAAASVTIALTACPPLPQVGALSVDCTSVNGVGTLTVGAADLATGQTWEVLFQRQDASGWVTVADRTGITELTASELSLTGVRSGEVYQVTLTSQTDTSLTDSVVVTIPTGCSTDPTTTTTTGQVDAFSVTAATTSLATTGLNVAPYAAIALLLLVPGFGLTVYAARRRRHREEADV